MTAARGLTSSPLHPPLGSLWKERCCSLTADSLTPVPGSIID